MNQAYFYNTIKTVVKVCKFNVLFNDVYQIVVPLILIAFPILIPYTAISFCLIDDNAGDKTD